MKCLLGIYDLNMLIKKQYKSEIKDFKSLMELYKNANESNQKILSNALDGSILEHIFENYKTGTEG